MLRQLDKECEVELEMTRKLEQQLKDSHTLEIGQWSPPRLALGPSPDGHSPATAGRLDSSR